MNSLEWLFAQPGVDAVAQLLIGFMFFFLGVFTVRLIAGQR